MLRVTVELVPLGYEKAKRVLVSAEIYNDGTGTTETGNYVYKLFGPKGETWRSGRIRRWDRGKSVWELVRRAITAAFKQ